MASPVPRSTSMNSSRLSTGSSSHDTTGTTSTAITTDSKASRKEQAAKVGPVSLRFNGLQPPRRDHAEPAADHIAVDIGPDDEDLLWDDSWTPFRIRLAQILATQRTEITMGMIIILNVAVVIRETDLNAHCYEARCKWDWEHAFVKVLNCLMLAAYTVELAARLYVYRNNFFQNFWNIFDCIIVGTGLISEILTDVLPRITILRIFRMVRLVRVVRLIIAFRELYLIISGFVHVAKTIFWATLLLFLLLTVCSIVAVDVLNPINDDLTQEGAFGPCDWCTRAFDSVMHSNLTLFQIVIVGDSWGQIAVPIIERAPIAGFLLVAVVVAVMLGFCNLILAVIVEKAWEARKEDEKYQLVIRGQEEARNKTLFVKVCEDLDKDRNGVISLEELLNNYEHNRRFLTLLKGMGVNREDMQFVFEILDVDRSGVVTYAEFAETLCKMKSVDMNTMLTFIKHHVLEVQRRLDAVTRNNLETPRSSFGSPRRKKVTFQEEIRKTPQDSFVAKETFMHIRQKVQEQLQYATLDALSSAREHSHELARATELLQSLSITLPIALNRSSVSSVYGAGGVGSHGLAGLSSLYQSDERLWPINHTCSPRRLSERNMSKRLSGQGQAWDGWPVAQMAQTDMEAEQRHSDRSFTERSVIDRAAYLRNLDPSANVPPGPGLTLKNCCVSEK